jgi:antitoxin component YwqK of YwqJK toxin-antitoxin module
MVKEGKLMDNGMYARLFAGALSAALTSVFIAVFVAIILFAPKPYPSIKQEVKYNADIEDGVHKTQYWVGLLKEEWNYNNGLPNGEAFQFYPNGSLYRKLEYVDGFLEGEVNEFREKPGRAMGVSRRFIPKKPPQLKLGVGELKAAWHYSEGKLNGEYRKYYKGGSEQEIGNYQMGKLHGFVREYSREGELKSEVLYDHGKRLSEKDAQLVLDTKVTS